MKLSKQPYKGTRDFFPEKKRELNYIFEKLSSCAEKFGHEPYDGPLLEEIDLYLAKSGEELINDQIYSFEDRGKRKVAIRPEMTPTLARMVARVHRERPKPFRWYSIPTLMRYERPQKGRLREHFQFNCDIFGASESMGEIEILNLLAFTLTSFGADESQFKIYLNDRKIVDEVFRNLLGLNDEQAYKLYKIVDRIKKIKPEQLSDNLNELGLDKDKRYILDKYLKIKSFADLFEFSDSHLPKESISSFKTIYLSLKELSIEKYFEYDSSIVRGLDYYTGLVFECFDLHPDNNRAICGGGAYANLLQIFNEPALPGVGFGLGDVTLTDFLEVHSLLPNFDQANNDIVLAYLDQKLAITCMQLANKLRDLGIKCLNILEPVKYNKALSQAEKRGASFLAIIGENEIANNEINLKNITTGKQETVKLNDIASWAKVLKNEH
jgi:histidyl-tRNA synthetase